MASSFCLVSYLSVDRLLAWPFLVQIVCFCPFYWKSFGVTVDAKQINAIGATEY